MYNPPIHQLINKELQQQQIDIGGKDNLFYTKFVANATAIHFLFEELYGLHPEKNEFFNQLIYTIAAAYIKRPPALRQRDDEKEAMGNWFLSNEITGMSLYVDRFCGNLTGLGEKMDYFKKLGVNFLHLMPVMESPEGESDGGYAVSDFRKVDKRFGTLQDLQKVLEKMSSEKMYLMLDIVLNHTSQHHEWALKAKQGDKKYQAYFYMYSDRGMPDEFEKTMPEIFPENSPGSFTYSPECKKWVMTVFHHYQWDLNYTNPVVLIEMLDTIFLCKPGG